MSISDDIDEVRARIGMRRPARIRIKRLGLDVNTTYPWLLKDTARPHGFGHAKTVEAALKLAELILAGERAVVHDDDGNTIAYRYEPVAQAPLAPCTCTPTHDPAYKFGERHLEGCPRA